MLLDERDTPSSKGNDGKKPTSKEPAQGKEPTHRFEDWASI